MHPQRVILVVAGVLALAYAALHVPVGLQGANQDAAQGAAATPRPGLETAVFAAGCFWCVEADFDKLKGVVSTTSGYTGGRVRNPTYEQVSSGGTGHTEAVEVVFDPKVVSYRDLLNHFWRNVDPFVANRQFCDVGEQYRPGIFVRSAAQRAAAQASRDEIQRRFSQRIVVEIADAGPFYRAEEYHQDYYTKNSLKYRYYRWGCGRDRRLADIWRQGS